MSLGGGVSTTTAIPTIVVSQTRKGSAPFIIPAELPSSRFKYEVWHDLKNNEIYANELKNPRIRKGPHPNDRSSDSESSSSSDSEDEDKREKTKSWRKFNYRDKHENWKEAIIVNLSYQNLGDDFQRKNFMKVLKILKSCKELHIVRNELRDISSISLPACRILNVSSNHISSFNGLPKASKVEHLNMTENDVRSLDGLERFKRLKTLRLTLNPVSYSFDYRYHVFMKLPHLELLDDIPKMESDETSEHQPPNGSCIIA